MPTSPLKGFVAVAAQADPFEEPALTGTMASQGQGALTGGAKQGGLCYHTLGGEGGVLAYVSGVVAFVTVWGGVQAGTLSPFIVAGLYRYLGLRSAATFLALAAASLLAPFRHSPAFCRFYLGAAACCGGATVWFSEALVPIMCGDGYMVCMHPHGILPLGFSLNGAIRAKTRQPDKYLPAGIELADDCSGVQAPVLWRVPFFAAVLRLWASCTPATKQDMKKMLAARIPFGILPGGSEEVAIHQHGCEHVYINSRYGFIKYGLEQGYALVVCYTFGESDQYHSLVQIRSLNLWLVKRFGFVLPIFWGNLFCPLLPTGRPLNTVYGEVVQLPKIEDPTTEDVVKWHKEYVEALKRVFDTHKDRFGYGDRDLKCF